MNSVFKRRIFLSANFLTLVGVAICLYFAYHAIYGNRSYIRLVFLNNEIATLSSEYDSLQAEQAAFARKVAALRPGSVRKDLLEERARILLGYAYPDETQLMRN